MSVKITNVLLLDNVDPSAKTVLEENGIKATLCKDKLTADELVKKLQVSWFMLRYIFFYCI